MECGKTLKKLNETDYKCVSGHMYFDNPAPAVGILPVKDDEVLVAVRGGEPDKGKLDPLGGFLNHSESAEETVHREFFEETGAKIKILDRLSSQNVPYIGGKRALDLYFIVEIIEGDPAPRDDVADLIWLKIDEPLPDSMRHREPRQKIFTELRAWHHNHKK
ncbi:MAG: NUDIX domain-containing protein [Candidatus Saccharimonadales bacterium]|nr:NUDIX domain-containing protein [Candidatus Saccharimonadales bacterium]